MPSKGVQVYSYISVPGCQVQFSVPASSITKTALTTWTSDHLEVDKKNISGLFDYTGRFSFTVSRNGAQLTTQYVEVNTLTGDLEDGTMKDMATTPSIVTSDVIITYGFYDAGTGVAGLPSSHQCWVTVSANHSNWMGDTIPSNSPQASKTFRKMVLPSAHDIGMNSMQTSQAILQKSGTGLIKSVLGSFAGALSVLSKVSDSAINAIAPDIIRSLAITQKDSLATILTIGARYFEFRPAHCLPQMQAVSPLPDALYFQHGGIPGMAYAAFLHDIVQFLTAHTNEIIVVQLRWDGVPADCKRPTDQELGDTLKTALAISNGSVLTGTLSDVTGSTIAQLRSSKKRLIITQNLSQVSSYDDKANATLDGSSIVTALNNMSTKPPASHPLTVLQCQATATNIPDVIAYSVLASEASTSCLLATKPVCDTKTLPLLKGTVGQTLVTKADGLCAVMNDFFDGGTADVAIALSKVRLA